MAFISWAQAKEDIYLMRALRGVRHDVDDPFYIDIGANDPEHCSVTKLFYDHGWHGINVDPSPTWHRRLVEQRPRDINIQAAVSDQPGELTFYDDSAGGLGTLSSDIAELHRTSGQQIQLDPITVKTITLTELCDKYAPRNIHFLKIDVEGAEGSVLLSMDFGRFRPWLLCIECHVPNHVDQQTYEEWEHIVLDAGYKFVFTDRVNRYYVAEEHSERAAIFSIPVDEFVYADDIHRIRALEDRVRELEQSLRDVKDIASRSV